MDLLQKIYFHLFGHFFNFKNLNKFFIVLISFMSRLEKVKPNRLVVRTE